MAHLPGEPQRLASPPPGELPDRDDVGGEPPLQRDLGELFPSAERGDAERLDLTRDVEIARGGPRGDDRTRELEGHVAVRGADHDVAALHADPPDADAKRTGLERVRQGEESGSIAGRGRDRGVELDVGGQGRHRELPAPEACDVDAQVDRRRAEPGGAGRGRARAHLEILQRHPSAPGAQVHGAHPRRLPERLREQSLDALARERRSVEPYDHPGAHQDGAHYRQHGEQRGVPPAKSPHPHHVAPDLNQRPVEVEKGIGELCPACFGRVKCEGDQRPITRPLAFGE
jgi:hypothetical protein